MCRSADRCKADKDATEQRPSMLKLPAPSVPTSVLRAGLVPLQHNHQSNGNGGGGPERLVDVRFCNNSHGPTIHCHGGGGSQYMKIVSFFLKTIAHWTNHSEICMLDCNNNSYKKCSSPETSPKKSAVPLVRVRVWASIRGSAWLPRDDSMSKKAGCGSPLDPVATDLQRVRVGHRALTSIVHCIQTTAEGPCPKPGGTSSVYAATSPPTKSSRRRCGVGAGGGSARGREMRVQMLSGVLPVEQSLQSYHKTCMGCIT